MPQHSQTPAPASKATVSEQAKPAPEQTSQGLVSGLLHGVLTRPVPGQIQALQRSIGNRGLNAALGAPGIIQRQETDETGSDEIDAELQALLDQLDATTRRLPTYEVISASSSETSAGELTTAALRTWRREHVTLTEAYRMAAEANTTGRRGAVPTQSAELGPGTTYAQRVGILAAAADYRSWRDLPEITDLLRRGSPFQQAMRGEFAQVTNLRNPSTDEMKDAIRAAVTNVAQALQPGEFGEVVFNFQGHGGEGNIYGVDEEPFNPAEQRAIAEVAMLQGVHIVYILDTCLAANAVGFAQARAADELSGQVNRLPPEQQAQANAMLAAVEAMGPLIFFIGHDAVQLRYSARARDVTTRFRQSNPIVRNLETRLEQFQTLLNSETFTAAGVPDPANLRTLAAALIETVRWEFGLDRGALDRLRRQFAPFLDAANDYIANMLETIDGWVNSAL